MTTQKSFSSSYRGRSPAPVDVLTYRYDGNLVYVPVSENYTQALGHARDAFPQLKKMKDTELSLYVHSVTVAAPAQTPIGIVPAAWPKIVPRLKQYEIIDVHVSTPPVNIPEITITVAEGSEPSPPYHRYQGQPDIVDVDRSQAHPDPPTSPPRASSPSLSVKLSPKWLLSKLNGS